MIPGPFPQDNPGSGVKEGTEWGSSPRKQLRESLSPLHPSGVPECTTEGRRGVSGGGMGRRRDGRGEEVPGQLPPGNHKDICFKFQFCFPKNELEREFPSGPGLQCCSSTVQDTVHIPVYRNTSLVWEIRCQGQRKKE